MPDVSLTIRSLRRYGDLLMTVWTAIAVSYLFAVLPFGNPNVGYMPAIPGPAVIAAEEASAPEAAPTSFQSNPLNWDGDCQEVWASLKDVTPHPVHWATVETLLLRLAPAGSEQRPTASKRSPPLLAGLHCRLRAPPLDA